MKNTIATMFSTNRMFVFALALSFAFGCVVACSFASNASPSITTLAGGYTSSPSISIFDEDEDDESGEDKKEDTGHEDTGHEDTGHEDNGHEDTGHEDNGHDDKDHGDDEHGHDDDHGHDDEHGHDEEHGHDPFDSNHLLAHVQDATYFEFPSWLGGHLNIAQPFNPKGEAVANLGTGIEPLRFQITKFMVLEIVIAVFLIVAFAWLAGRVKSGEAPTGKSWNMLEAMVKFVRDDMARPAIGKSEGDKYVPMLCTLFFFILGCNLMGMIPWLGSPTAAWAVTIVLALFVFGTVVYAGMSKMGFVGFFKNLVPHIDLPIYLAVILIPLIFVIELISLLIKHFVLSVRLLANMVAGHVVLVVFMTFWTLAGGWDHLYLAPISIGASTAIALLEVFVAFLQAYIFTFLSAIFIGAAVHSH